LIFDLTPKDLDFAQIYDGFSTLTLLWLEALGICGAGEAASFVEGGERIALDGVLPLNTSGGQPSTGRFHGYGHTYEACLQLWGLADERQVKDARAARGIKRRLWLWGAVAGALTKPSRYFTR
jgi:acetyl-CoA acetyltransferase